MCLAKPVKIAKVSYPKASLEDGRQVDLSLIDNPQEGDWLLCHANLAINKLPEDEAQEILKLNKMCTHKEINVPYYTG